MNSFATLCVLALVAAAQGERAALFWLSGSDYLSSAEMYREAFHQWVDNQRPGYVMSGSAYALKHDGTFGYATTPAGESSGGEWVEKYGLRTLKQMGLTTTAMIYTTHYDGLSTMLANPKPFIDSMVKRALDVGFDGYNLDYEPQTLLVTGGLLSAVPSTAHRSPSMLLGKELRVDVEALQDLNGKYGDFMKQLGTALHNQNLTMTIDINGCPSHFDVTCKELAQMRNLWGVQTMDTFGVSSLDNFKMYEKRNKPGQLEDKYWPGFVPNSLGNNSWLGVMRYLAKSDYTGISTWASVDVREGDNPQWFFDGVNAFLDL